MDYLKAASGHGILLLRAHCACRIIAHPIGSGNSLLGSFKRVGSGFVAETENG